MTSKIAFLGMGGMAKCMTRNLVDYGDLNGPLILYNRTRSKAVEHSRLIGKSVVASTVSEAVCSADIIWSCLQDETAVQNVVEEALQNSVTGKLFIDSSSLPAEHTKLLGGRVMAAGAEFISMPVMGDPTMAEKRLLTCIAAGSRHSIERVRPYVIGVIGRSIIELTDEPVEQGSLLKLMGNVLIMLTLETVAEVNVFAEKCGLGVKNMQKLMSAMFPQPPHSLYNERMISGGYYMDQPMVEIHKAVKISSHVMQFAKAFGASIPGYEVAARHLEVAQSHAGAAVDITSIYGAVRLESDLAFKNSSMSP